MDAIDGFLVVVFEEVPPLDVVLAAGIVLRASRDGSQGLWEEKADDLLPVVVYGVFFPNGGCQKQSEVGVAEIGLSRGLSFGLCLDRVRLVLEAPGVWDETHHVRKELSVKACGPLFPCVRRANEPVGSYQHFLENHVGVWIDEFFASWAKVEENLPFFSQGRGIQGAEDFGARAIGMRRREHPRCLGFDVVIAV